MLLMGAILQLDGLWENNQANFEMLDQLDQQLTDLRHATNMLSVSNSQASQSFYMHLAEGANPQMLLADLKGQIDLLSMKMAQDRQAA